MFCSLQSVIETAQALMADDKGLLAIDESNPTCNKLRWRAVSRSRGKRCETFSSSSIASAWCWKA